MAFAGFGANNSSGFGANNNSNNKFGGFGATSTGFGNNNSSNTNTGTGFGSSNTGSGLFGATGSNNNASTGSTFGGFGAGNSTGFGASTNNNAGSSLFGGGNNNQTTGGFGGFGGNNSTSSPAPAFGANTNSTPGAFGSTSNAGSSLFGNNNQNKPAFGATTGGGLFGSSTTTTPNTGTGFGSTSNNATASTGFGGFGASASTGFGQQAAPQNQGTATTPFEPVQEKDATTNGTTNIYQTIACQPAYQKFSHEELRLADYNAGRRYGNSNGQAGAFGQNTGFGGFGQSTTNNTTGFGANNASTTGGGLFGSSQNNTSSPFGAQQNNTNTGFGANSNTTGGGGLFGNAQNNTTGGGLFGGSNNTTTNAAPSGGLFGSSTNTTGGFGSNANTGGGGLFGTNNTNTANDQNKPAFGGFGATNTNTGGGLFGNSNTSSSTPFGQQNNTAATGGGLFGNSGNNNQPQQPAASGGLFGGMGQNNQSQTQNNTAGGGLFGGAGQNNQANQQKPGGLFGNATGGGLFGNNNQQPQQSGSLFGNTMNNNNATTNNNTAGGGLFGAKPATTGNSLFGNNTTGQTGTSLFGNNQTQTQQPSLFGNNNNQNQAKPSLFGNNTNPSGGNGSSLFGGGAAQNNNQSLLGNSQSQQPMGGSLFGQSQQQAQPQQQQLTASLAQNPYGNDQLFANLGAPAPAVGPLATPLSGSQKPVKRTSIIPAFKINPSASMRLITPQKPSSNYGLSYSTYGTPGSSQSFSMSRGSSLLGSGGLNRPLSKSLSTSSLRTPLSSEDTVLAPGAFTANHRPYGSTHSIRKLRIDRSLRTDIFGDADGERRAKRVSFGNDINGATNGTINGDKPPASGALVRIENDSPEPSSEELGLLRAQRSQKDGHSSLNSSRSERDQSRGNELAIVPENETAPSTEPRGNARNGLRRSQSDQEPGEYYMIPSLHELRDMSKVQLKNMSPFIVGRVGIGKIEFSKVDLTTVPLEQILGNIVRLNMRSATVYESAASTPPQGKGLNVPSRITLENSWPRSNGGLLAVQERKGPRFDKHIERLRRVTNTEFIDYDSETGEWIFSVQHFTTYGLDESFDDDDDDVMLDQSNASAQKQIDSHEVSVTMQDGSLMSPERSDVEDTFEFKRPSKSIPGGFSDHHDLDDTSVHAKTVADKPVTQNPPRADPYQLEDPFRISTSETAPRPASPPMTDGGYDEHAEGEDDSAMTGAYPEMDEQKSNLRTHDAGATPMRQHFDFNDDWAVQLQRTVSPRKQDRQTLREVQKLAFEGTQADQAAVSIEPSAPAANFSTTLDIMNSLWGRPDTDSIGGKRSSTAADGFKWPYPKRPRPEENPDPDGPEQAFHESAKPHWSTDGTLTYAVTGDSTRLDDDIMISTKHDVVSEGKDVRFAAFVPEQSTQSPALKFQLSNSKILTKHHEVAAAHTTAVSFATLASKVNGKEELEQQERQLWTLASILFDPLEASCSKSLDNVPADRIKQLEPRIRRDAVIRFWAGLTSAAAASHVNNCASAEEKALAHLSAGDVEGACIALVQGKNFHLATMVAQLPNDEQARHLMRDQIKNWRNQNVLSEMSKPVRALYALIAGDTCVVEGKSGAKEDRAPTFAIAEMLGLDWRRAFGLRLLCGSNDLAAVVQQYSDDVAQDREVVKPLAPGKMPGQSRQDPLMGLLRLYAQKQSHKVTAGVCNELVNPLDVSGSPLHARLAWQLATMLRARHIVSATELSDSTLDSLSQTLGLQLETAKRIVDACNVMLHISTSAAREIYVKDLFHRRASLLTADDGADNMLTRLTETLRIPASWFWTAKAQYAAAMHDYESQAAYLLSADDRDAAHDVLTHILGPRAIVSGDYDSLREILGTFLDGKSSSQMPSNWATGGQVYFDYIHLMDLMGPRAASEASVKKDKTDVLQRLCAALPTVLSGTQRGSSGAQDAKDALKKSRDQFKLEEKVAVSEMAARVRSEVLALDRDEAQVVDDKTMSRLPVPDDSFVRQGVRLTGLYYRAIGVQ